MRFPEKNKVALDRLAAIIVSNTFSIYHKEEFQKDLFNLIKHKCWKIYGQPLTQNELKYCRNQISIIWSDMLDVLKEHHY